MSKKCTCFGKHEGDCLESLFKDTRDLSLEEVFQIIRILQGQILTLIEASVSDAEQRKAMKDIVNNYVSHAHNRAQDTAWEKFKPLESAII